MTHRVAAPFLDVSLRGIMKRNRTKSVCLTQKEIAEFGAANPYSICQHCLKHRIEIARR